MCYRVDKHGPWLKEVDGQPVDELARHRMIKMSKQIVEEIIEEANRGKE